MRTWAAGVLLVALTGCAYNGTSSGSSAGGPVNAPPGRSSIVQTAPDTYAISRLYTDAGAAAPRNQALTRASAYCASLNKVMLASDERINGCATGCVANEIRFKCLDATDPRISPNGAKPTPQ